MTKRFGLSRAEVGLGLSDGTKEKDSTVIL